MRDAVLFQNSGHIGFGDVAGKGAVAEDDLSVAGGGKFFVPGDNALRQCLHILTVDGRVEAGEQGAITDAVDGFVRDCFFFDGDGKVYATLE